MGCDTKDIHSHRKRRRERERENTASAQLTTDCSRFFPLSLCLLLPCHKVVGKDVRALFQNGIGKKPTHKSQQSLRADLQLGKLTKEQHTNTTNQKHIPHNAVQSTKTSQQIKSYEFHYTDRMLTSRKQSNVVVILAPAGSDWAMALTRDLEPLYPGQNDSTVHPRCDDKTRQEETKVRDGWKKKEGWPRFQDGRHLA